MKIVPDAWVASNQKLIIPGIERATRELITEFNRDPELSQRWFQTALREAEAVAWETEYPQLVFPALAEEKLAAISQRHAHEASLHDEIAIAV